MNEQTTWTHQMKSRGQRTLIAILFVGFSVLTAGFSQAQASGPLSCRQAHRLPDWVLRSLSKENLSRASRLSSGTVNNEADGYHLLKDLPEGGAHFGLGGDSNYTLMGEARSSGGAIYDFDPTVIAFHHMVRAAFLTSETPSEFRSLFMNIRYGRTNDAAFNRFMAHLGPNFWKNKVIELCNNVTGRGSNSDLGTYMQQLAMATDERGRRYTYLGDAEKYAYVRKLFIEDKIRFYLKSHFEPHALKEMSEDLGVQSFSTIYVSNSLEFRWLDPMMFRFEVAAQVTDAFRKSKKAQEALVDIYNEIEAEVRAGASNTFSKVYATLPALDSIKRGQTNWRQFWQNISELSWSDRAVMLTTSRDWGLFGAAYSQIEINRGGPFDTYNWIYATVPRDLWMSAELPEAATRFYEKMKDRYDQLLSGSSSLRNTPAPSSAATQVQSTTPVPRVKPAVSESPYSNWPYKR